MKYYIGEMRYDRQQNCMQLHTIREATEQEAQEFQCTENQKEIAEDGDSAIVVIKKTIPVTDT